MAELARSLAAVWRTLRSMRTALYLLLVVGAASITGSLVPQAPNSPQNVARLFRDHPLVARIYDTLGLFDVFGSWWFTLAYALLFVSLVSCLIPRTRAMLRSVGSKPQRVRDLEGMRHHASGWTAAPPSDAVRLVARMMRKRGFRVVSGDDGVAAEKGVAREVGSLLFHWSFLLLLLGAMIGKGFGFSAQATVIEGAAFTEAHASYDFPPSEGRFYSESMHRGFRVRVRDFQVRYRRSGVARDFVSRVDVLEGPRVVRRAEIRVNSPLV
ncbi:MAG TPA: cytochrome c biogenesis protein ResB, partial [Actinomycetota bacterium]|nr:cytochrome c biogenesis protein ResB [Actinomycetota bacterium]